MISSDATEVQIYSLYRYILISRDKFRCYSSEYFLSPLMIVCRCNMFMVCSFRIRYITISCLFAVV